MLFSIFSHFVLQNCCSQIFFPKILKHVSKDAEFYGELRGVIEISMALVLKKIHLFFRFLTGRS
jgi:hypothetical protein